MPDTPRKRIVIAEDDPAIGTMLLKVLSQFYDVVVTSDGASAIGVCMSCCVGRAMSLITSDCSGSTARKS